MVVVGVTPEGSELLLRPNNHPKVGLGTSEGKGLDSKVVAEHISEKFLPAVLEPEGEMVTGSTLRSAPKSTMEGSIIKHDALKFLTEY